ncbi:MAG: phospholipid carrier-dependent glycosyltransferase [Thermodesulfovibrionia bacterium]|nr:phospholipid carrier-dependent glycosyltransferase [Thermodesulfovibrionia bacterium]
MVYALISQEIISGNGISMPMIYSIKDNFDFINGTIPYVGEPPLLPILLALLGGITPESYLAAQILNVISHVAISILTFLLMKKMYDNNGIALLTGILVSFSFPLLKVTNYILSDPLFNALTMALIYFLILSQHSDQNKFNRHLLFASICISAAILTRFAGAALVPVFFWGVFILVKNKSLKLKYIPTILTILLPFITIGVVFTITYILSGSIHGWIAPLPNRSYFDAFTGTMKMILLQFQIGEQYIPIITIFAILFILYITVNANTRRALLNYVHSGADLIIVFIISHTMLITHAMATSQTVFELRYMSPLVPFLFILSVLIIVAVWEVMRLKGFSRLSLCWIVLSLSIITFGNLYKTFMNSEMFLTKRLGHYRILNSHTFNWIKENYGENIIITSNRPYHLSFFGGYSTIRLPHRRFNKNYRIPDNMDSFLPNRMSHFGSRVLALFEEVDEQHEGEYLAGLFNNRTDDKNFILMHKFSDGVVYSLKEQ